MVGVWQGQTASPIVGVSTVDVNANGGSGHVTVANVDPIAFGSTTAAVPIFITSWQPNAAQITVPSGFTIVSSATDGYASVAMGMALDPSNTAALPQFQLQFSNPQAVVFTQQIAIGVNAP